MDNNNVGYIQLAHMNSSILIQSPAVISGYANVVRTASPVLCFKCNTPPGRKRDLKT